MVCLLGSDNQFLYRRVQLHDDSIFLSRLHPEIPAFSVSSQWCYMIGSLLWHIPTRKTCRGSRRDCPSKLISFVMRIATDVSSAGQELYIMLNRKPEDQVKSPKTKEEKPYYTWHIWSNSTTPFRNSISSFMPMREATERHGMLMHHCMIRSIKFEQQGQTSSDMKAINLRCITELGCDFDGIGVCDWMSEFMIGMQYSKTQVLRQESWLLQVRVWTAGMARLSSRTYRVSKVLAALNLLSRPIQLELGRRRITMPLEIGYYIQNYLIR